MAWTTPRTWSVSEVLTAANLNTHLRDNTREIWRELAYVEFTSNVSTTTATEASPLDVVSSGSITFTAQPILIVFEANAFDPGAGDGTLNLWEDSTDLGRLASTSMGQNAPVCRSRRLTPSAAAHTYKVRVWTTGGATALVAAGAGGAATGLPGFLRILQRGG